MNFNVEINDYSYFKLTTISNFVITFILCLLFKKNIKTGVDEFELVSSYTRYSYHFILNNKQLVNLIEFSHLILRQE